MENSKYHKEIYDLVYKYDTKYKEGFIRSEINDILTKFPNINKDYFEDSLYCITCTSKNSETVIYHHDVYKAIICGMENRGLSDIEWD